MDGGSRYTVSQMARMFGLSRQTLIYYDRKGLFSPAARSKAGYRFYLPTQIPTLRLICVLRDLGLPLERIAEVVGDHNPQALLDELPVQRGRLEQRIARLVAQRDFIDARMAFYQGVVDWQAREGEPVLREYPTRRVLFEPFPEGEVGREVLHDTLMRAISRLHGLTGAGAVAGFGTMLARPGTLAGAGSFVVVPDGVELASTPERSCVELPAGEYACLARRGMPYDMPRVDELLSWVGEKGLVPRGAVFDFCLLDATSYDEGAEEDFCVAQVLVA